MIYLNGKKLDFQMFPNGETRVNGEQIRKLVEGYVVNTVTLKYENDSDLIKLMFVKRHIDSIYADVHLELDVLYMPYSRMDRVEGDSVFTLKYVAEFINNLKFDTVEVVEPHSDVTPALLDKVRVTNVTYNILDIAAKEIGFDKSRDFLFFPDQGAAKRYSKLEGYKVLVGHKTRDFATGQITGLQVLGVTGAIEGAKIIILDDLCSYGGTFYRNNNGVETGAAAELKKLGVGDIYLIVAHCENAILEGSVLTGASPIKKVFTTNSIIEYSRLENLEVMDIIQ